MKKIIILIFILAFNLVSYSQNIKFNGLFQAWFSYAQQDTADSAALGFTFRRIKLLASGTLSKNIDWFLKFGWDKQIAGLTDAGIYFRFNDEINIKVGKFPVPGSPSGTLTSSSKMDFIERAMMIQKWGSHSNLADYRNLGVQIDGSFLNNNLYYALMIQNSSAHELFNPSLKDHSYVGNNNIQFSGRVEIKPMERLRLGGFFLQGNDSVNNTKIQSFGTHGFYQINGIWVKAEYLFGENKITAVGSPLKYSGFMLKLGFQTENIEPVIRYDYYKEEGGFGLLSVKTFTNITLGINYYYSKRIKFQANYVIRGEIMVAGLEAIKNNLFYINLQYVF